MRCGTSRIAVSWIAMGLFTACLAGCASTNLEPLSDQTEVASLNPEERSLWTTADRLESEITAHVDPVASREQAEKYLGEILAKLTVDFKNPSIHLRIHVLPDPSANAFVLPNGAMYVNTGLLALMDNEAQLATVLGHEFSHFLHRHSYREKIKDDNEFAKGALMGVMFGALAGSPGLADSTADLWRVSSVRGYSRELESQADRDSLIAMLKAGYAGEQAIKAFEKLQSVSKAEAKKNERFATHPKLSDRIASYRKCLQDAEITQYASGSRIEEAVYNEKLFDAILDNAALSLKKDEYDIAASSIERCLKLKPECARAYYLRGELLRTGPSVEGDVWQKALECYTRAIQCDPNFADSYREVGLLHRQLDDRAPATESLQKYLSMAKDAADVPLVKSYMEKLASAAEAPAKPYRAPAISDKDFRDKIKTIGIMRPIIPDGISSIDKKREEFESALTKHLEGMGFKVVPSSVFVAQLEATKKLTGAVYDPNTGELLKGRGDVIADYTNREYMPAHQIDALAYPAVVVVSARWVENRAEWHGTHEAATGKEGFWANVMAPSAYGTMGALSFRLAIVSTYGDVCYAGFGGIQLCSRVSSRGFVDVPAHELLMDPARNANSVDIACKRLREEAKSGTTADLSPDGEQW